MKPRSQGSGLAVIFSELNELNSGILLMQQHYPEIRVKLLKRRELRAMMVKFGLYQDASKIQGSKAQTEDRHD